MALAKQEIVDYWSRSHSAFTETLGEPERVVFGEAAVYLQVRMRLDFLADVSPLRQGVRRGRRVHLRACRLLRAG